MTNSLMTSAAVIDALCALNEHARAYGAGKHAIYAYKSLTAALLVLSGEASARLVQWTGTCGHCGGTGRYVDSYGEKWPHCRQCCSTGTVTLKFVETTNRWTGAVWHHPWKYGEGGGDIAEIAQLAMWDGTAGRWRNAKGFEPVFWNVTSDWKPNRPAEKLIPDDAAGKLNTVEAWLLELQIQPSDRLHWMRERALRAMREYVLDLGRIGLRCWFCESPDIHCGLSRPGPPFAWSAPVCKTHSREATSVWPNTLPEWVMTPPLVDWKRRHDRIGYERDVIFSW